MLLTEVTLHNVGVYRGRQVVPLGTTPARPIVLIGGLNGCGKTTLLDSLQLALYGPRARCSGRGDRGYEDFLRGLINVSVPSTDGAAISLSFTVETEGETCTYTVNRAWREVGAKIKETVDIYLDNRRDALLSDTWAEHVEELLPLEIASLFFFDGEKIEALADPDRASAVIETAVHALLGIGTLDQLRTDLVALQRRQVVAGSDPIAEARLASLQSDVATAQAEVDVMAYKRGSLEVERNKTQRVLDAAEAAFHREGGVLFEQRTQLEVELNHWQDEVASAEAELRELAEGALPLALVAHLITDLQKQSDAEVAAADSQQLQKVIADRDEWLLRHIDESSRPTIAKLLSADRSQRASQGLADIYLAMSADGRDQLRSVMDAISSDKRSAQRALERLATADESRTERESKLAGVPAEETIARQLQQRDDARLRLARLDGMLDVAVSEQDRVRQMRDTILAAIEKERQALVLKSVAQSDARRIVDHSERVREILSELKGRLVKRHLGRIEVATLQAFRRLLRKQNLIVDLRIDPQTYSLTLLRGEGVEVDSGRLSAGERQLLAVALLWGLAQVAGGRIPTVVDTPLGRLDSEHRQRLANAYFPNAGEQVLLLSTDEEIDEVLVRGLAPAISHSYLLVHDESAHETRVTPGYWWAWEDTRV